MNSLMHSVSDIVNLTFKSMGFVNLDSQYQKEFNPPNQKFNISESSKLEDLLKIIKSGKKDLFFGIMNNYGSEILYEIFPQSGDTLMHWACLSGNLDIVSFLKVLHENNRNPKKLWSEIINCKNALHQTPLHWACTIENIATIQFLINEGADINAVDNKGVNPLIMSCQYGNISGAIYLILNGANVLITDVEGDNALHWALYKGHAELARLLIFYGLNCSQKDSYGQTPLHFACLSGNINCVADLVEKDNVEINVFDNNNKTPIILAAGRKHKVIVEYLKYHINKRVNNLSFLNIWKYKICGNPNKNRYPMIFFLLCAFLWGNPYYIFVIRPCSINYAQFTNFLFIVFQCMMWFCFFMTSIKDPGYIAQKENDYNVLLSEIKLVDNFRNTKLRDYKNPINKMCHSCRGIKQLRTKHCKICDKCVDEMDHHCPYVGNCIGKRNRSWFLFFVILMNTVNILVGYLLCIAYTKSVMLIYTTIFTASLIGIGLFLGFTINFFMFKQALLNITLVETQKWKKYNYLQNEDASFNNPFDQGWWTNLLIFFNVKRLNFIK